MSSSTAPQTFAETLARVEELILGDFDREIAQKQLYYHDRHHAATVRRRAKQLLNAVAPYLKIAAEDLARMDGILSLCAMAHDAIQIFAPHELPHDSRRRETGLSETATVERLLIHIRNVQRSQQMPDAVWFTEEELQTVRDAVNGTICLYDDADQAIYQPVLYQSGPPPSLIAQLLAMADIGSLGMDGIESYNEEGSLLFLEENPDTIPFFQGAAQPERRESIRQRLLRRAQFQVRFARSRLARYPLEIARLPAEAFSVLKEQVFQHLNEDTVRLVEATTPTEDGTTLETLSAFFRFEHYLSRRG